MRFEPALVKWGLFGALIFIAWMALWYYAFHHGRIATAAVAVGWFGFLVWLFRSSSARRKK